MTKPKVPEPVNGNIYAVMAAAKKALQDAGDPGAGEYMVKRAIDSGSYEAALRIIREYVDFRLE